MTTKHPEPPDPAKPIHAVYTYDSLVENDGAAVSASVTEYFDAEAASYDDFDERVARRRLYLAAVDALVVACIDDDQSYTNILSFGCGTGRREAAIRALYPNRVLHFHGVDRSSEMRRIARSRGISTSSDLASLTHGQEPAPFDLALCLYSFIHLPTSQDRRDTLRGIRQMMRPGGTLLIDVFNLHDRHEWESKLSDGCTGQPPPQSGPRRGDVVYRRTGSETASYMHYFTLSEIVSLIEAADFRVTSVLGVGHGFRPGTVGLALDEGCLYIQAVAS